MLHNPNNWHWVNKDASTWARDYLDRELIGTSVEDNGISAKIDKILNIDGDVDVSQRKGKVITLFDVKLQLEYSGKTKDGEEVNGTINVPEVAHDTAEDEYVFEIEIYSESASKVPVKDLVRTKLTPILRKKLCTLGPELISSHSKDLQHAPDAQPRSTTPKWSSNDSSTSAYKPPGKQADGSTSSAAVSPSGAGKSAVNVTTVTSSDEFRCPASELYTTFTDPQRITAFTRAPPKVFEGPHVGARFELFGGNVAGEFTELKEPTCIVQKWRLKQWPEGHYSTLEINFDQNDVDAVTVMRVKWKGVPVGQEEVTRRNWGEYYVRSIKTTFGFGTIL
ncbi:MAG: hypothetical protein M1831_005419 [Alyxoria varia]|nr:MAG: hypothetical protein M1831_005419 [Alyxoria varia]